jgi:hypothetical protein
VTPLGSQSIREPLQTFFSLVWGDPSLCSG